MTVAEALALGITPTSCGRSRPSPTPGSATHLGQSDHASGGEAQRMKLAKEPEAEHGPDALPARRAHDGLHFVDEDLLGLLDRLVEKGNSVVVIEHNLDANGYVTT